MSSELYKIYEGEFLSSLQEIDQILINLPSEPHKCLFFSLNILILILDKASSVDEKVKYAEKQAFSQ